VLSSTPGSLTELTLPDLCDSAGVVRRFMLRDSTKTSVLSVQNSGSGIIIRLKRDTVVQRLIVRDTTIVERTVVVQPKKRKSKWPILLLGADVGTAGERRFVRAVEVTAESQAL